MKSIWQNMEVNNNYFIINMIERVMNGECTLFLNQAEFNKITRILNKEKVKYKVFYPYEEAEKVIVYRDKEPEVTLLEIKSKKDIKHADILGSLFGNNISPNNYGDIIIMNDRYYLIVFDKLLKFFLNQFNQVGRISIEVKEAELSLISGYRIKYEELRLLCSSLRIDNVVSSITNLSRSSVDDLFLKGNILLNYDNVKKFKILEEGDILSIRKYGKYKFNRILGQNKKGKIIIEILKYK